ncbi:MAG: radical SAM protein [Planctomycetes bacterium]|nr:radical SAM protein [Planctomycetota bacterium]
MTNNKKYKYIFGPVPSRRLGRSLGVDIVPLKTCSQNCIYCQLGVNAVTTIERKAYVDVALVAAELKDKLAGPVQADFITISGSGEPTLNSDIGRLIDQIKEMTDIPVAVITNGTLLNDWQVRADISRADAVMPSLDAGDEDTFRAMNCPHADLTLRSLVDGLMAMRKEYKGQIWLEVFFCDGVNTSDEQVAKIGRIIKGISPDKVQLNTAVRPTSDKSATVVSPEKLSAIAKKLGFNAEIIAGFPATAPEKLDKADSDRIVDLLKRRPCSIDDMVSSLNVSSSSVEEVVAALESKGLIKAEEKGGIVFYVLK